MKSIERQRRTIERLLDLVAKLEMLDVDDLDERVSLVVSREEVRDLAARFAMQHAGTTPTPEGPLVFLGYHLDVRSE